MVISEIVCPGKHCPGKTVLPRRSPLGTFEGLPCPTKDAWPALFLCRRCDLLTVGYDDKTHQDSLALQGPIPAIPLGLWRVAFECAHENCGEPYALYARWITGDSDATAIALAGKAAQTLPCKAGHHAQIDATTAEVVWLPF